MYIKINECLKSCVDLTQQSFGAKRKTARCIQAGAILTVSRLVMALQDRTMIIRDATEADVPEIQSIYAHHVLTGTGTFEEEPPSVEEVLVRYRRIVEHGWRWLVATDETGVLGYGYYSQFRERTAYRYCVEDSVYVRENVRGQGVGKALVQSLVEICTAAGMRQMIAVIGDSENVGSIGVHASLGFQKVGTLHASGIKFGRWLDSVYMQRALGRGDLDIPA
jgi:L-amino acid N-acyltransferase YncA